MDIRPTPEIFASGMCFMSEEESNPHAKGYRLFSQ
jgi:hypothetical protein